MALHLQKDWLFHEHIWNDFLLFAQSIKLNRLWSYVKMQWHVFNTFTYKCFFCTELFLYFYLAIIWLYFSMNTFHMFYFTELSFLGWNFHTELTSDLHQIFMNRKFMKLNRSYQHIDISEQTLLLNGCLDQQTHCFNPNNLHTDFNT